MIRVHVDRDLCQGHGMCEYFAPSIFKLDDDLVVQYEETPDAAQQTELGEAVAGCPARAISLVRD